MIGYDSERMIEGLREVNLHLVRMMESSTSRRDEAGYADLVQKTEYALDFLCDSRPRLLTLQELFDTKYGDVVWMERRIKVEGNKWFAAHPRPLMRDASNEFIAWQTSILISDKMFRDPYDEGLGTDEYRYWSCKPTDEEREAEPWK